MVTAKGKRRTGKGSMKSGGSDSRISINANGRFGVLPVESNLERDGGNGKVEINRNGSMIGNEMRDAVANGSKSIKSAVGKDVAIQNPPVTYVFVASEQSKSDSVERDIDNLVERGIDNLVERDIDNSAQCSSSYLSPQLQTDESSESLPQDHPEVTSIEIQHEHCIPEHQIESSYKPGNCKSGGIFSVVKRKIFDRPVLTFALGACCCLAISFFVVKSQVGRQSSVH